MQFFNTVYSAVKHSRPLIQRIGVSNDVPSCILNQSFRAFASRLDSDQEAILSSIPLKPKRPPSVYLRYVKMVEPKLIQQFPNAKRTDIIKTAAKMYKDAEKETLIDIQSSYFVDMEQYKKDIQEYQSKLTDEQKDALSKLKTIEKKDKKRRQLKQDEKATNKPKQPLNPYMLFLNERRAEETPTGTLVDWTKKISEEWKNLPEDEKNKYIAIYKNLRLKYNDEIAEWEASLENTEYSHLLSASKKSPNASKKSKSKTKKSETKTKTTKPKSKVTENRVSSAQTGKVPQNKK